MVMERFLVHWRTFTDRIRCRISVKAQGESRERTCKWKEKELSSGFYHRAFHDFLPSMHIFSEMGIKMSVRASLTVRRLPFPYPAMDTLSTYPASALATPPTLSKQPGSLGKCSSISLLMCLPLLLLLYRNVNLRRFPIASAPRNPILVPDRKGLRCPR